MPGPEDFTEIVKLDVAGSVMYCLRVKTSEKATRPIGRFVCLDDAEMVELAIKEAMIAYTNKRLEWMEEYKSQKY